MLFRSKCVNLLCCLLCYSLIGEPCAQFIPIPDVMTSNPWCCSPGRLNHVHGQSVAVLSMATRSKAWLVSRVGSLLFACNPAGYTTLPVAKIHKHYRNTMKYQDSIGVSLNVNFSSFTSFVTNSDLSGNLCKRLSVSHLFHKL